MNSANYAAAGSMGAIMLILMILGIVVAILWTILPFYVMAINKKMKRIIELLENNK